MDNTEKAVSDDWENRVLCSDEACIGVIGPDGRCKECGKAFDGQWPVSADSPPDAPAPDATAPSWDTMGDEEDTPEGDEPEVMADDEWSRRTLCSDDDCIGVIGADGRCKECGKPHAS